MSHLFKNNTSIFSSQGSGIKVNDTSKWNIEFLPLPNLAFTNVAGMLLDQDKQRLLIATYPFNNILVYDINTFTIDRIIDITGKNYTDIKLDTINNRYLLLSQFSGFYPINRNTLTLGNLLPTGDINRTFALDDNRNQIITTDYQGNLATTDFTTLRLKYKFFSPLATDVRNIKVDPFNPNEFYIIGGAKLSKLNASTNIITPIAIPYDIYDFDFDPRVENNNIYVTGAGTGLSTFCANSWALTSDNIGPTDKFIAFNPDINKVQYFIAGGYLPRVITQLT